MMGQLAPTFGEMLRRDAAALQVEAAAKAERRSEGREVEPQLPRPRPDGLFSELGQPLQIVG